MGSIWLENLLLSRYCRKYVTNNTGITLTSIFLSTLFASASSYSTTSAL